MKNIKIEDRANRGGSWYFTTWFCRASYRYWLVPGDRDDNLGFRVVHRRRKP